MHNYAREPCPLLFTICVLQLLRECNRRHLNAALLGVSLHELQNSSRRLRIYAATAGNCLAVLYTLNPTNDNRTRSDAMTGNSEGSDSDLIGNVSGTRWHRAVLSFDLSSIPDGFTVTEESLAATFGPGWSGNSANFDDGTADITVQEMTEIRIASMVGTTIFKVSVLTRRETLATKPIGQLRGERWGQYSRLSQTQPTIPRALPLARHSTGHRLRFCYSD